MKFLLVLLLTFVCASIGLFIQRSAGWPYWSYHAIVVSFGAVLYGINSFLIARYIRRRAPEFASNEEAIPGIQKWELTAGLGVVPKWTSWIGLVSIGFLLASPFELIALLMRKFDI